MDKIVARKEKRVCFDFKVEFSNGGGIQGQGFRLDIDGDDIADEEFATYIIRDLLLLMVGKVRILNKQIIEEPHKRAVERANTSVGSKARSRFVDLSHMIENGLITLKG